MTALADQVTVLTEDLAMKAFVNEVQTVAERLSFVELEMSHKVDREENSIQKQRLN